MALSSREYSEKLRALRIKLEKSSKVASYTHLCWRHHKRVLRHCFLTGDSFPWETLVEEKEDEN